VGKRGRKPYRPRSFDQLINDAQNGSRNALLQANLYLIRSAKSGGCSRCTEKEQVCLDFHHRDPKTKLFSISAKIRFGGPLPLNQLMAEIAKCSVVCSNCHRKLHAEERRKRARMKELMARRFPAEQLTVHGG